MEDSTASEQLASKAVDFQTTAEAYYSIAVEKVKDVGYVAGFVSISSLAVTADITQRIIKSKILFLVITEVTFYSLQPMFVYVCGLSGLLTSCHGC